VQVLNLPVSWYEATAHRDVPRLFTGSRAADLCVIGGGLAGLTVALEAARAGASVILFEASAVGCGASGRNGGFVSNGFALGIGEVAKQVGIEAAQKLYQLSAIGTEFVRATILQHDPSIVMGQGARVVARYDDGGDLHRYAGELRNTYQENVLCSPVAETRNLLQTTRYFDSVAFPKAFHIHPLRYCLLLKRLCEAAGGQIFENSAVQAVRQIGDGFQVQTDKGDVRAKHVVHCVSAVDRQLHQPTARALLPVSTYIAVTAPLQQDVIRTGEAISDTRRAGNYFRRIDAGRILWGGRITTLQREPRKLAEDMRRDIIATFPQLSDATIDYAWSGVMGYALHKMPLIGRDGTGQWYATGFGGHGINTTAMAGVVLARAITQGDETYRQFAPYGPRWTYGPLGRLGVQGSYWWMQARDRFDEKRGKTMPR
jgi:gamma-glutamylputrescine oxidase